MLALFVLTLFLSSFLLFCVQPLVGKWLLPLLGGVPSIWNTCLFFFQAALLLGYGYAHFLARRLGPKAQAAVHLGLCLLPALTLPFALPGAPGSLDGMGPVLWLLGVLSLSVGPAFLALSTTAPLLQDWFSRTSHGAARNPYFLYAASNAGSLLGLLAYPFVWEPLLALTHQSRLWAWGYGIWLALTGACAWLAVRHPGEQRPEATAGEGAPGPRQWALWIGLALLPSSLLMGVTTYLSSEVGSVPLLWVIPLALYLLSFVIVFSSKGATAYPLASRWYGLLALPLLIAILIEATEPPILLVPLHLITFFVAAVVCHGALAAARPAPRYLTGFYLCLSVGGALGGAFNALLFPVLFSRVIEYPLGLVLVALCRRPFEPGSEAPARDWGWAAAVGAVTLAGGFGARQLGLGDGRLATLAVFGLPALLAYRAVGRPRRFTLALGALALAAATIPGTAGRALHVSRNFFGVLRVTRDPAAEYVHLVHGNTFHGRQATDPARRREPLLYYSPTGPVGRVFDAFRSRPRPPRIAVVGLGAGSLACFARPGDRWTFYEIDPAVAAFARSAFSFLGDCAPESRIRLGDARIELQRETEGPYGLLVVDAFSSDAIPVHLMTREALVLYLDRLAPEGLLAFHISNRHLDLKPVLARLAEELGLAARVKHHDRLSPEERRRGLAATEWLVMARNEESLGDLAGWDRPVPGGPRARWTDVYSNVVGVMKW